MAFGSKATIITDRKEEKGTNHFVLHLYFRIFAKTYLIKLFQDMLHFKEGIGWKACYDDERNLFTAKMSWRGDFHLYEIDAEIYNRLGEPEENADELIGSGRHLYYSQDSPIGPPTDMVIDENYATLCSWAVIQKSGNTMSSELTDVAVDLWENEKTREQRKKQASSRYGNHQ